MDAPITSITPITPIPILAATVALVIACIAIIFYIDKCWVLLFPRIQYMWGKEQKRLEKLSNIRGGIMWTVIIGGIIGVLIAVFV